jgi:hypothetical protein
LAGKRALAGHGLSNLRLLSHLERIVHLNPEVPHRTFKFGMAWEELNCAQVLRVPTDQRCLRAPHRVSAVRSIVQSD